MQIKKHLENGRTMVEMLAVLMVIGAIGIGMYAGISEGLVVYRASILKTQLPQMAKAVSDMQSFGILTDATNIDYPELFSDILGNNACSADGCNTSAGFMSIRTADNGNGVVFVFDEMSEKMCYEISSTARGDEGTGIKGVVLANSCNTDSIQTVEFLIDTQSTAKRLECGNCPGDTICLANNHNDEPVYRCACLNTNAIQGTDGTCTFEN